MRKLLFVLLSTIVFAGAAADRNVEVDHAFSKLMSMMPVEGQLMLLPYADNLNTYGEGISVSRSKDSNVTGGKSLIVDVKKKGDNPWDSGVVSLVPGHIEKRDVLYLMFWARATSLSNEKQSVRLNLAGIQQASAPYETIIGNSVVLGREWNTHAIAGRALSRFEANESQFNVQIASDKHQLEFGPVFLLNLGSKVEVDDLPFLKP